MTPVTRHELNGVPARVAAASDPTQVGIAGRVVSETTNTLVIRHDPTQFPTGRGVGSSAADESSTVDGSPATAERSASGSSDGVTDGSSARADEDRTVERAGNRATTDSGEHDGRRPGDKRVPKRGTTFEFAVPTDEAASTGVLGSAFELPSETAGTGPTRPAGQSGGCENVGYVTVDGARLVARPARRTERAGDTLWQSD